MPEVFIQKSNQGVEAGAAVISNVVTQVGEIVKELEKVAISSPFMSFATAIITADLLHNAKIISDNAYNLILTTGTIAIGVKISGDIINEIVQITDLVGNRPADPGLFSNSVTTLVTVQGHEDAQLNALFGKK